MNLNNDQLFQQHCYINGEWVSSITQQTVDVLNPYNQNCLGTVPNCGTRETEQAIQAAQEAFLMWRDVPARERADIMKRFAELMRQHREDLAKMITLECGKPIKEARAEVDYGASYLQWNAELAWHIQGESACLAQGRHMVTIKQPKGVVAIITPWNFPSAMLARTLAPALAAGCTVVAKPAEDTPYSALALAVLASEAGVPKGVFNVVTGEAATIGKALCQHFSVRHLTFTGSTKVGKLLMQQCAETVKTVSLELGGNAPFIVFADANVEEAVEGLLTAKFRNAGQTCVCANRIFIQEDIYTIFVEKLLKRVQSLMTGDGLLEDTQVTTLINQAAFNKVECLVQQAVDQGATVLAGGKAMPEIKWGYLPTILEGITADMAISQEEIFGPVLALQRFIDEADVITRANASRGGLAGYFFSQQIDRVWRVAKQLEVGMVGVNTGLISTPVAPFGGVKESGFGKAGADAIEELLDKKYINL